MFGGSEKKILVKDCVVLPLRYKTGLFFLCLFVLPLRYRTGLFFLCLFVCVVFVFSIVYHVKKFAPNLVQPRDL